VPSIGVIYIDPEWVRPNIVIFGLVGVGVDVEPFLARLVARGVRAVPVDAGHVRMVTHRDVAAAEVARAGDVVEEIVNEFLQVGKGSGR
jgi:hypothetical protein